VTIQSQPRPHYSGGAELIYQPRPHYGGEAELISQPRPHYGGGAELIYGTKSLLELCMLMMHSCKFETDVNYGNYAKHFILGQSE